MKDITRALANRIRNLISRGTVKMVKQNKMQTLQVQVLDEEIIEEVEHWEPYGFTAYPFEDAEALMLFANGNREHGIAISVADRKYRLKILEEGEVALYDDQGNYVHLKRDLVEIYHPDKIVLKTDLVDVIEGDLHVAGDATIDGDLSVGGNETVAGNSDIGGNQTIGGTEDVGGTITAGGDITSGGDVVASGTSLKSHVHLAVQSGSSVSGPPQ